MLYVFDTKIMMQTGAFFKGLEACFCFWTLLLFAMSLESR